MNPQVSPDDANRRAWSALIVLNKLAKCQPAGRRYWFPTFKSWRARHHRDALAKAWLHAGEGILHPAEARGIVYYTRKYKKETEK